MLPDPHFGAARVFPRPLAVPPGVTAALLGGLALLAGLWVWQQALRPAQHVAFIHYAAATVNERVALWSTPVGGSLLDIVVPGDRLAVGGRLATHAGLARADILWVSFAAERGTVYGYLPEAVVVLIAGDAPVLDVTGPLIAGEPPPAPVAAAASAAGEATSHGIAIPWLPAKMEPWEPLLVSAGAAYGVDPDLLAIIALVESGGNPRVISRSGAVGLMQVMPSTAEGIAAERGIAGFDSAQLADAGLNIDFGAYYLSRMLLRYGQVEDPDWRLSVDRAAAAYNGGPGSVDSWLASGAGLPAETERYRKYVTGMWSERRAERSTAYEDWLRAGGWQLVMPEAGGPPPEVTSSH